MNVAEWGSFGYLLASVCLLSLGAVIVAGGLLRLSRLDRERMEYGRQSACRWHQWRILEGGTSLVCAICGKKSPPINPSHDRGPETISSQNIFP